MECSTDHRLKINTGNSSSLLIRFMDIFFSFGVEKTHFKITVNNSANLLKTKVGVKKAQL